MPALNKVVNWAAQREFILFPVSGAGSNIPAMTPLMPGVTAGTNIGVLIPITATSNADAVGLLEALHSNSVQGDATYSSAIQWFPTEGFAGSQNVLGSPAIYPNPLPTDRVCLFDTATVVQMDYAITAALTGIAATSKTVTSMTGSTQINNTSFSGTYDTGWVYFSAGTALGQLGMFKSSVSSTSATLIAALTTTPVAGDTMILIRPLFHALPTFLVNNTTVPTLLDTNPADGSGTAAQIASFINRNGNFNRLDPKIFNNTQKLNNLTTLGFTAFMCFQDTIFHVGS